MANLIPGILAYVKYSEEPVYVLGVRPASAVELVDGFSGQIAMVRRFHIEQYHTENFLVEELETSEEKHARQWQEMNGLKKTFEAAGSIPETFSSN